MENSLDAGATSLGIMICVNLKSLQVNLTNCLRCAIDIRFKNNGLDLIEVQDNGKGISPDDYETVGRDI